jgi:hypothetical protein
VSRLIEAIKGKLYGKLMGIGLNLFDGLAAHKPDIELHKPEGERKE